MRKTQNENDLVELMLQQDTKLREFDQVANVDTQGELDIAEELGALDDGINQAIGRIKAEREQPTTKPFSLTFTTPNGVAL